jgi:hypothetical protein
MFFSAPFGIFTTPKITHKNITQMKKLICTVAVPLLAAMCGPSAAQAQTAYSNMVSNDAPVVYWNFDEPSGNARQVMPVVLDPTVNDLVPVNTATRVSHSAIGSGLNLGNAASFLVGDYFMVQALATSPTIVEGPWAIEFWIRLQGSQEFQRNNYLLSFGPGGGNAPAVLFDYIGGAQPRSGLEIYSSAGRSGAGPLIQDENWHHVVFAFYGNGIAGVSDRLDIYLDGALAAPNVRATFSSALSLTRFVAGTSAPQFAGLDGFEGELDEIAIYDLTGLTDESQVTAKVSQIAAGHFALAKGTGSYSQGVLADQPLLYWSFDEAEGNARQLAPFTAASPNNDLVPAGGATRVAHNDIGSGLGMGQAAHFPEGGFFRIGQMSLTNNVVPAPYLIEFWMQAQGDLETHPRNDYLINLGGNNDPAVLYDYVGATGPSGLELYRGGRTDYGPTVTDGNWHHVLFAVYGDGLSGVADRVDAYIDGAIAAQGIRGTFVTSQLTLTSMTVGSSLPQFAVFDGFEGNIDELAFYDLGSLTTEAEVTARAADIAARHYAAAQVPSLQMAYSGGMLTISWSASATGFNLESSPTLANPSWTAAGEPVIAGDRASVTVVPDGQARFFRLKK